MTTIAIGEVAKLLGVSPQTVRKYVRDGRLPDLRTPGNARRFDREVVLRLLAGTPPEEAVAASRVEAHYLRVSGRDQETSLASQERLLAESATGTVVRVYRDRASGLNDSRPGLTRLLRDASLGEFTVVRATHVDRVARFGVGYVEALLARDGVSVEYLDDASTRAPEEELLSDFMALVASFSGRLYRLRGHADQRRLLERAGERLGA